MRLLARMDASTSLSNREILFNPISAATLVQGINHAGAAVVQFHGVVGVAGDREALEAKRWIDAFGETRDHVIETGAMGIDTALRFGRDALDHARIGAGKAAGDISERLLRQGGEEK